MAIARYEELEMSPRKLHAIASEYMTFSNRANPISRHLTGGMAAFLLIVSCVGNPRGGEPAPAEARLCDGSSIVAAASDVVFLLSLQRALQDRNSQWLANHIDFPLKIILPSKETVLIKDGVSLQDDFAKIFPQDVVQTILKLSEKNIRRSARGVELGETGFVCLPVPGTRDGEDLTYLIYHVPCSAPSEAVVSSHYNISWTDMVFFIQIKEALRHNDAQWIAVHTATPFVISDALGKRGFTASRQWLEKHFDDIWHQPRIKIAPQEASKYRNHVEILHATLSETILNFPTSDLRANWQGVTADRGTVWYWGEPHPDKQCFEYHIITINPVGFWPH